MGWSTVYDFAIKGEAKTIENIKSFFEQFPLNELFPGFENYNKKVYDLNTVRRALYGDKMQETGDRVIFGGSGTIDELTVEDNGTLHIVVDVNKNFLESKCFIKALRKKVGKFRYAVLVDDTDLYQDEMPWTTDRTGEFFPHFVIQEGTPEQMKTWPTFYEENPGIKETCVRNSTELLKELRKRGHSFRSFKELVGKTRDLSFKDTDGNIILAVIGISSGKQTLRNPMYIFDE